MKKIFLLAIVLIGFLTACQQNPTNETATIKDRDDNSSQTAIASSQDSTSELALDTTRQYLQTANLKMQVRKLEETKAKIREIVRQQKGFILSSELKNNISDEKIVSIDNDSSMQVRRLSRGNNYSLKIPAINLDSTTFLLEKLGVHIDNSSLNAQDITMQWLKNSSLKNDNTIADLDKIQASNSAGIDKVMTIHELKKQQMYANAEKKELSYNILYADMTLEIYEFPTIQTIMIVNTDKFQSYKTPFGYQLKTALIQGVDIFQSIIVALTHLWLVLIILAIIFIFWKRNRKKNKVVLN